MSYEILTDTYSDQDMACPSDWENGYKEALVKRFGDAERTLSDPRTGERAPATMDIDFIDDRRFREQLASNTEFWSGSDALTVRITSRANRAIKGEPYTVFVGPVINAQPTWSGQQRGLRVTLGDLFTRVLQGNPGQDRGLIPWRMYGDGFLDQLLSISDNLDRRHPEQIIYGKHIRIPPTEDEPGDPASPEGFVMVPVYLGTIDVSAVAYHVWGIAGHACADVPFIRIDDGATGDEGTEWLIPHHTNHDAAFGAPYIDYRSSTYGNDRRYTLLFGKVTDMTADPESMTDPDACAAGHKQLTVGVLGTELNGDGSGDVLLDRIQQYKHFKVNYCANRGLSSYQSGVWLENPTWDVFGVDVTKINEDSYDACSVIAEGRLPSADYEIPSGYIGAALIGATAADRSPATRWTPAWDRSCGLTTGQNHLGQDTAVMCHPTQAIKDAADLYTDVNEILLDSFGTDVRWSLHANQIPFKADYNWATGVWMTADVAEWEPSIEDYDELPSEPIEYDFAPGITASYHLARLEVLRSQRPPRFIELSATIEEQDGSSLAYLDLGDYLKYRHLASVSTDQWEERLAQIIAMRVEVGNRRVHVLAVDVEDLIGYDDPPAASVTPDTPNDTCADAIDMGDLSTPYDETFDTTDNGTDGSQTTFGGSNVAYHAAWFKMTGNIYDGVATFSAVGSAYDTQLAAFSGSCGALVQQGFNDNFASLHTSALDVDIVGGTDYFVLVCGYGPDDGGILQLRAVFTPNP